MELLLNLVWALIAALMFVWWSLAGCRTTRTWRFVAGMLTLLCVALLLFPVISMTDDLNPSMMYAEDANAIKRIGRSTSAACQVTPHALPAIASAVPRISSPRLLGSLSVDRPHVSLPASRPSRIAERSPPSLLA
jgi:hypothetical protein